MTPDEKERAPKAVFSSQYHGFGTMKAGGEPKSREFTITNQGKEPLRIRDMKLGDRMSTTLDPDRAIAPGETVSFVAMLSTKNAPAGRLMDHIVLILNRPSRPLRENTACGYDRALGQGGARSPGTTEPEKQEKD